MSGLEILVQVGIGVIILFALFAALVIAHSTGYDKGYSEGRAGGLEQKKQSRTRFEPPEEAPKTKAPPQPPAPPKQSCPW